MSAENPTNANFPTEKELEEFMEKAKKHDLVDFQEIGLLSSSGEAQTKLIIERDLGLAVLRLEPITEDMSSDGDVAKRRMARHATILEQRLPGIIRGLGYGVHGSTDMFIVTKFMPCGSLANFTNAELVSWTGYKWDITNFLIVVHRLFQALAQLHSRGWIHRDVKPSNVLMDENMIPCLADMEFARKYDRNMTNPGTLFWTAPEVVEATFEHRDTTPGSSSGDNCDTKRTPAADVYSAGLTIYFLFTGETYNSDSYIDNLTELQERETSRMEEIEKMKMRKSVESQMDDDARTVITDTVMNIIRECCQVEAAKRPTASDVCCRVEMLVDELRGSGRTGPIDLEKWNAYLHVLMSEVAETDSLSKPSATIALDGLRVAVRRGCYFALATYFAYCFSSREPIPTDEGYGWIKLLCEKFTNSHLPEHENKLRVLVGEKLDKCDETKFDDEDTQKKIKDAKTTWANLPRHQPDETDKPQDKSTSGL